MSGLTVAGIILSFCLLAACGAGIWIGVKLGIGVGERRAAERMIRQREQQLFAAMDVGIEGSAPLVFERSKDGKIIQLGGHLW